MDFKKAFFVTKSLAATGSSTTSILSTLSTTFCFTSSCWFSCVSATSTKVSICTESLIDYICQSKSQSIPNNLSDRINDIINKNESIVGRFNNRRNSASGSELLDPPEVNSAPVRKRAVRGPWRYEERILQVFEVL